MGSQTERNPKAVEYIKGLILRVCQESSVRTYYDRERGSYCFEVTSPSGNGAECEITFSEESLEDFQVVLERGDKSSCGLRFTNYVRFEVYIGLGKAGLIPSFRISQELLDEERRDWWKDRYVRVAFDRRTTDLLYKGLKRLEVFLATYIGQVPETDEVKMIKEDLERIKGIVDYYDRHNRSLDESAASVRSLSLLKAGAISEILELEKAKVADKKPGFALRALDAEIYSIVELLRGEIFLEVQSPKWLKDYAEVS